MTSVLKEYLKTIEASLKSGNATEHTHRPALIILIESLDGTVTAVNEPRRIECGAPDFAVTKDGLSVGYLEAKDVGKSLAEAGRTDQLKRYRRALDNLILTDYLDFRWYTDGELRQEVRLAYPQSDGRLKREKDGLKKTESLIRNFLKREPRNIGTPRELARRMAQITHMIRDIIVTAFETGRASILLQSWREAFSKVLIADLNLPEKTPDFADMFAQTLAYGLFTARIMERSSETFTRQQAQYLIPKSNPFLRDFFVQITGPQLDDEPFASFADDLVNLLAHADMASILADFGRRTRQEDPIVHFYETFLAAYDPKLREARGVYYTPEPVVSYIVRSVDHLLKTHFKCPKGLADDSRIDISNLDPNLRVKGKKKVRKTRESHKVLVLDFATGTATFLYAVIDHIRRQFMEENNAGMWAGYVKHHLLPRLFGFELLMAPYAVAHFKLSLQLAGRDLPDAVADQWAYHPGDGERLGIYLTNALEEPHEMTGLPLFTQWVADETNAASEVKKMLPVLVVIGNPPYSGHSANKGKWIDDLLKGKLPDGGKTGSYYEVDGKPLGEKNPKWLQDDYVKFIRFGQWRIEQSGHGVMAIISNNGYLDNPTFRGMRQCLMQSFTEIYLLDLHGNAKKQETAPDGGKDENVFDIMQGVGIGIFVKKPGKKGPAKIYHADLWGTRAAKYQQLLEQDITVTDWKPLTPQAPFYLFRPHHNGLLKEFNRGWKITDIFPVHSVGIVTARDHFTIHYTEEEIWETVRLFAAMPPEEAREKFSLGKDVRDWKVNLAQSDVAADGPGELRITPVLYRPFDIRYTYYTGKTRGFICMPRPEVMQHLLSGNNLALITSRMTKGETFRHVQVARNIVEVICMSPKTSNNGFVFPLYIFPTNGNSKQKNLPYEVANGRRPNLNPDFVKEAAKKLKLSSIPEKKGDLTTTFGPEDIFHYIYAVFHCPSYRERYGDFLKIDFPRVPLTSDVSLFRSLCESGKELAALHLLNSPEVQQYITRYPVPGNDRVEKGYPKFISPQNDQPGRISVNKDQYFEGVPPEVWDFWIGGYQPARKWLKDRRGRMLTYDDLTHYQKIIAALKKTIEIMERLDTEIQDWPIR